MVKLSSIEADGALHVPLVENVPARELTSMTTIGGTLGSWAQEIGHSALAAKLAETLGPVVLSEVISRLNSNGLGAQVNSWLGRGANQPLTADELRQALGDARLQALATKLGIPADAIAGWLAKSLPAAVDHAAQAGLLREPTPGGPTGTANA